MKHHKLADNENTQTLGNPLRQKYLNYTFELIQKNDWHRNSEKDIVFLKTFMPDLSRTNQRIAEGLIAKYNNSKDDRSEK